MITKVKFFKNNKEEKVKNNLYKKKKFEFFIDGNFVNNKLDLFEYFTDVFDLPVYMGKNWDGLVDFMSNLSWFETEKITVYISNIEKFLSKDSQENKDIFYDILINSIKNCYPEDTYEDDDLCTLNFIFNVNLENENFINQLFKKFNIEETNIMEM